MQINIQGCEYECSCDHCGRALKVGVQTDALGVIGSDCFVKLIKADRQRYSRSGKPDAAYVRTLAKLRQHDSDEQLSRMGFNPARTFTFELAAA